MDKQLHRRLEEALKEFGSSGRSQFAGADDAGELSAYLEIASSLQADARALSGPPSSDRGREQLLSSLRSQEVSSGGVRRMIFSQPLIIRVAGAAAGVAMLFVGMAGASAAAGGPDIADTVFDAAGIGDSDDAFDDSDHDGQEVEDADDGANEIDDADEADDDAEDADDDVDDDADDDVDDDASGDVDDEADDDIDDDADDDADEATDEADDDIDAADDTSDDSADDATDDADVEDGVEDSDESPDNS